eukprot:SM000301S11767  [mRNA]  locus=s301:122360:123579:- [translate_table: standard]
MSPTAPCAASSLRPQDIDHELMQEAALVHCTASTLLEDPARSALLAALAVAQAGGAAVFFDANLPLPLWRSPEATRATLAPVLSAAEYVEVSKQELEFLLGEEKYDRLRFRTPMYAAESTSMLNQRHDDYHYTREEVAALWHDRLRLLLVTDGTRRIHYYTPTFHGVVEGTEDILLAPYTADRTGSGDAIVAGMSPLAMPTSHLPYYRWTLASCTGRFIRKLVTMPGLEQRQDDLEKALRFAVCGGIIAQWTTGALRGYPTASAAQNLTEQVYQPSMVGPL